MRSSSVLSSGLVWLLSGILFPAGVLADTCTPLAAKLVSSEGSVEFKRYRGDHWRAAALGHQLCFGDQLRVGAASRASVELRNDTILRLDQHSSLVLPDPVDEELSFVSLLEGALHLISRVKGKLEVRTPVVNAGLEGTEFIVRIEDEQTIVSVIEGRVAVSNPNGMLHLSDGQSASASANTAPVLRLDIKPEDAVRWALHYPSLADPEAGSPLAEAQRLLQVGRVDAADDILRRTLAGHPNDSEALALRSVIALAQNRKDDALHQARNAVDAQASPSAMLALSYAQQANFDIDGAAMTMQQATSAHPDQALLWSRLSELRASQGRQQASLEAAQRAVDGNPNISRTQTVLGFAHLGDYDTDAASDAFEKAIALDSADPLPRLGKGLALIRDGDLAAGRREMEIAVSLDPGNSLVRSYLGKAYAAEKRNSESSTELALAKKLDPLDPTPWLYDAYRKLSNNNSIAAIRDFERSVALNNNRAIFRSRLLLDDDLAARTTAIGSTYAAVGLRDLGLRHGQRAIAANPANASAHDLLADLYRDQPRLGMARVSERLRAQLLRPLASRVIPPSALVRELDPGAGGEHFGSGSGDYSALFETNGPMFRITGLIGGNNTTGIEAVHAGKFSNFSYQAGYFDYETDGFRDNADEDREIYAGLVQSQLTNNVNVQLDVRHEKKNQGDLRLDLDPLGKTDEQRRSLEIDQIRLGTRVQLSGKATLLGLVANTEREERLVDNSLIFPFARDIQSENDGMQAELQLIGRYDNLRAIIGGGKRQTDTYEEITNTFGTISLRSTPVTGEINSNTFYLYTHWIPSDKLITTFGASWDEHDDGDTLNYQRWNPKAGIMWQPTPGIQLRAAYAETTKHRLISETTLEPTTIVGIPQFYDDYNNTSARLESVAIDLQLNEHVSATLRNTERKINYVDSPDFTIEKTFGTNLTTIINDNWTATAGYLHQTDEHNRAFGFDLETNSVPLTVHYENQRGYFGTAKWTYFDQTWTPTGGTSTNTSFNAVTVFAGYRWNKNRGRVTVGVDDLLDDVNEYRDDRHKVNDQLNVYRPFVPGRTFWASIQLDWE